MNYRTSKEGLINWHPLINYIVCYENDITHRIVHLSEAAGIYDVMLSKPKAYNVQ